MSLGGLAQINKKLLAWTLRIKERLALKSFKIKDPQGRARAIKKALTYDNIKRNLTRENMLSLARLARLHNPIPIILVLAPAFFVFLAERSDSLALMVKVLLGGVLARSAGCIINDVFDLEFDKETERAKVRPIAKGELSAEFGVIAFAAIGALSLLILVSMGWLATAIGLVTGVAMVLYPLSKRFFKAPQVVLGLVFNMGAIITSAAINKSYVSPEALMIYAGCALWTVGYDTIYAMQDVKFDRTMGIFSIPVSYKNPKKLIGHAYDCATFLWVMVGPVANMTATYYIACMGTWLLLRKQLEYIEDVGEENPAEYGKIFRNSNLFVAAVMVVGFFVGTRW